jgi:hypothetical protein
LRRTSRRPTRELQHSQDVQINQKGTPVITWSNPPTSRIRRLWRDAAKCDRERAGCVCLYTSARNRQRR